MPSALPTETDAETETEIVTDEALLQRYAERHDPSAFAELANRRAGLVFGVCLRITADRHDAEELTQDCFLQLARKAVTVQTSVAGWLHQVATHRALNAVRSRGRRQARESQAATLETEHTEPAWSDVEPLLDEAVDALPDDVREAIILHFLQSLPQEAVAQRLGVHQSTVSRRIDRGLNLLRERLTASGAALSAAPLSALLAANISSSGVPSLAEAIGKIALAGAGSGGLLGWLGISWANLKAWGSLIGAATVPVLIQLMAGGWHGFLAAVLMTAYIAWKRPAWVEDLSLSSGGRVYEDPFYPFRRWTWTVLPQNWRERLFAALMAGFMMGGMALSWTFAERPSPGMAAMFLLYSVIPLSTAARIVVRVIRFGTAEANAAPAESVEPPTDLAAVVQNLALLAVVPLIVACLALVDLRNSRTLSRTTLAFLFAFAVGMAWVIADSIRNIPRYYRAYQTRFGDAHEASAGEAKAPARSSRVTTVALAFILLMVVNSTILILFEALPDAGATSRIAARQATVLGGLPPLSLLFLVIAIRPFARLRGTTPRPLWLFAVAVAALCAMVNLGLCVVWLWPKG